MGDDDSRHGERPADVPAALRGIVEKALEKEPVKRYQSMREMVVDLRRLIRQSGETVPPAASSRRSWWAAALIWSHSWPERSIFFSGLADP